MLHACMHPPRYFGMDFVMADDPSGQNLTTKLVWGYFIFVLLLLTV